MAHPVDSSMELQLLTNIRRVWSIVLFRVSIIGLSADTTHTLTVYTEIDDVIISGVDVTVRTLPNAGQFFTY